MGEKLDGAMGTLATYNSWLGVASRSARVLQPCPIVGDQPRAAPDVRTASDYITMCRAVR